MSYVKHILLPNERMLYDGHVHPTVLLPGMIRLGIAAFLLIAASNTGGGHFCCPEFSAVSSRAVSPTAKGRAASAAFFN